MNKKKIEAAKVYWHDAVEEVFAHPEKSIREVAQELRLRDRSLYSYILSNYRERWNKFCNEEHPNLRGRKTTRAESYKQVVAYIKKHPEETLASVACKFGFHNKTSMAKYLRYNYPDLMIWRKEWKTWNKEQRDARKRLAKRAAMEEAKRKKEEEREREQEQQRKQEQQREQELKREQERIQRAREKQRAWPFKELDAPVVPFAERIDAMQKRLNDIKNGLGDNFEPGDLPLLKVTPGGYSVKEWQRKQHTLDIVMRRMEEVRKLRGES